MNTVTAHTHTSDSFDMLSVLDVNQCACDSEIVGGPRSHSGARFIEHMRRANGSCTIDVVCEAHLTYSLIFCAREMPELENIELQQIKRLMDKTLDNLKRSAV